MGIGALLALAALAWILRSTRGGLHHVRTRRRSARTIGQDNAVAGGSPNNPRQITGARDERAAAVIRDAERALGEARRKGDEIVEAAEAKAAKMHAAAERRARTIIRTAEEKARELAEAGELDLADARLFAAREREAAAKTRDELRTLLLDLLDEAKSSPTIRPATAGTADPGEAAGEAR